MPVFNTANHRVIRRQGRDISYNIPMCRSEGRDIAYNIWMCRSEEPPQKKQSHLVWERETDCTAHIHALSSQLCNDTYSSLSPRCQRCCSCSRRKTAVRLTESIFIYYARVFPQNVGLWKVPNFGRFGKSTKYWRSVWSIGGMILRGQYRSRSVGTPNDMKLIPRFVKFDQ